MYSMVRFNALKRSKQWDIPICDIPIGETSRVGYDFR